jgi:hypothetical protein
LELDKPDEVEVRGVAAYFGINAARAR